MTINDKLYKGIASNKDLLYKIVNSFSDDGENDYIKDYLIACYLDLVIKFLRETSGEYDAGFIQMLSRHCVTVWTDKEDYIFTECVPVTLVVTVDHNFYFLKKTNGVSSVVIEPSVDFEEIYWGRIGGKNV